MRALCLLFLVTPLFASAVELSLTDIAASVRSSHPSLKAAQFTVAEARGRQLGAGRRENPTASFDVQNESRVSPQTAVFAVDQSFPLTQRLALEKKLSAQQVTAAEMEVKDAARRLVAEAQSIAVRLLALDQQRLLRVEQTKLVKEFAEFITGRAKAGEVSSLEATQAELDAQRLSLETRKLENERVGLLGSLRPMIGLGPQETLTLKHEWAAPAMPTRGTPWKRADYQLSQQRIESAATEQELAKAKKWKDLSAGLFASREKQDVTANRTEHTGFIGLRLSMSLPLWNRNEGEIAEKQAAMQRARAESDALRVTITSEAETAWQEMEAAAALAKDIRSQLLPLVTKQADLLAKAYEQGQGDLQSTLRARDQRLQLEASAVDTERDFHLARLRYQSSIGQ